jgi:membrane glycosyltransferase
MGKQKKQAAINPSERIRKGSASGKPDSRDAEFRSSSVQRLIFTILFLLVDGCGILLFTDYLWRSDLYGLKYALLILFFILFSQLSFSFCTVLLGFISRLNRKTGTGEIRLRLLDIEDVTELPATALLFPIYNEDVERVFAGVELTCESLQKRGQEQSFDIFILSDSTDPEIWMHEEAAWVALTRKLKGAGRVYYRHRAENRFKKSGNISDFLENWGKSYRYMVIFDADSLIPADTLIRMVVQMERRPRIGLLQTSPSIIRAETIFGRMQQFSNRFYGPIFTCGLNYWQQNEGNYWGHNAIIRTAAFTENCALPHLPWRAPIGGHILSHDFVEAALLRNAGYEVWLTTDEDVSFEEAPQTLSENAKRDRRWCQGNLQHSWLLFAKAFMLTNKLHFLNGILSYLGSFFWFWFLVCSTMVMVQFEQSGLTFLPVSGFMRFFDLSMTANGFILLGMTALMVFASKYISLLDILVHRKRRQKFGGGLKISIGVLLETFLSIWLAPLNMLWHTWFVILIPFGKGSSWGTQQRKAGDMITLESAIRLHGWQTLIGLFWAWVAYQYGGLFFWWLMPVVVPMILAIPVGMLFTSKKLGTLLSRFGICLTPEEIVPDGFISELGKRSSVSIDRGKSIRTSMVRRLFLDPYANSHHVILQRHRERVEPIDPPDESIIDKVIREGIEAIDNRAIHTLLANSTFTYRIHKKLWLTPESALHTSWIETMDEYIRSK